MAGSKSAFLEEAFLDYVLGLTTYTPPATVYVALSLSAFDPNATGSSMDEVTAGGYARIALTNNTTNWPAAVGSAPAVKSNGTAINFGTATSNWGTVLSVYIIDAATLGDVLFGGDLAAPVTVNTGSSTGFPVATLVLQET